MQGLSAQEALHWAINDKLPSPVMLTEDRMTAGTALRAAVLDFHRLVKSIQYIKPGTLPPSLRLWTEGAERPTSQTHRHPECRGDALWAVPLLRESQGDKNHRQMAKKAREKLQTSLPAASIGTKRLI